MLKLLDHVLWSSRRPPYSDQVCPWPDPSDPLTQGHGEASLPSVRPSAANVCCAHFQGCAPSETVASGVLAARLRESLFTWRGGPQSPACTEEIRLRAVCFPVTITVSDNVACVRLELIPGQASLPLAQNFRAAWPSRLGRS